MLLLFCNQHILCDKTNTKEEEKREKEARDGRLLKMEDGCLTQ